MRVREAQTEELEEVYLMGYDTWGGDLPLEMYLESCEASYKFKLGKFYVLEGPNGELLSSCIVYPLHAFGGAVSENAVGLGSLATQIAKRHQGYASIFLSVLMEALEKTGVDAFFIHSDIPPRIYESLGFSAIPADMHEKNSISLPMLRFAGNKKITTERWKSMILPRYF